MPIRAAVVGPPMSGKSSLVQEICKRHGTVRISIGSAIRAVLDKFPELDLTKKILDHLYTGAAVPDELSMEAVSFALLDSAAATSGYVFDGFPQTLKQVEVLRSLFIIPVSVIELEVAESDSIKRNVLNRATAPKKDYISNDDDELIRLRYAAYNNTISSVRSWYSEQHRNWYKVNGQASKWSCAVAALEPIERGVYQQQLYLNNLQLERPAPIDGLCLTPTEISIRLGKFQNYCPVR